jgi:hypothetical protein
MKAVWRIRGDLRLRMFSNIQIIFFLLIHYFLSRQVNVSISRRTFSKGWD